MDRHGPAALTIGALAVLVLLGGCSGGSDEPKAGSSGGMHEMSIECARYAGTAQRITDAQTALYDGKDSPADATAVDDLVTELEALKKEAPDRVDAALTDLEDAFRSAQRLLKGGAGADSADLTLLATQLADDSQAVTAWIVSRCRM